MTVHGAVVRSIAFELAYQLSGAGWLELGGVVIATRAASQREKWEAMAIAVELERAAPGFVASRLVEIKGEPAESPVRHCGSCERGLKLDPQTSRPAGLGAKKNRPRSPWSRAVLTSVCMDPPPPAKRGYLAWG